MGLILALVVWFLRAVRRPHADLVLENLALRQQLAAYSRTVKQPRAEGCGTSVLGGPFEGLGQVALGPDRGQAGDGDQLASTRFSALLALAVAQARSSEDPG